MSVDKIGVIVTICWVYSPGEFRRMRHTTHIADWAYKEAYGAWEDVVNEVCSVRREVR